jgi:hypothetical protein
MGLFNKDQAQEVQSVSQRQKLEGRYASSRHNILLVLLFTAINVFLLLTNSNTYFLFSAYIPYAIVDLGMFLCGKYPEEFYGDLSQYEFLGTGVLAIFVAVAAVICVLYLLCWLLSKKKRVAWMIIALVLFVLDTVLMFLGGVSADSIIDVVFHGWVILSLSLGIAAHFKLKKLPEEETVPAEEPIPAELPQE